VVDTITSVSAPIGTEIAEAVASINTNPILASMGGLQTVALATVGLFGLHKIFAYLKDQEALTPRFFSDNDLDGVMAKLNEIATNISISIDDISASRHIMAALNDPDIKNAPRELVMQMQQASQMLDQEA